MYIKNKLIIKALIGFILGMFVGIFFWYLNKRTDFGMDFIVHLIMSGVFGLISFGGAVVYDIESWGVRRATATHYLMVMISYVLIALFLGWYNSFLALLPSVIIMTIIYIGIWKFESWYWHRAIREMNEYLKGLQKQ